MKQHLHSCAAVLVRVLVRVRVWVLMLVLDTICRCKHRLIPAPHPNST
jgi:hypothetical protein